MNARHLAYRLRAWWPLLPLLTLVFASYWLSLQVQPLPPLPAEKRHDVDYEVNRLAITALDVNGQPRHVIAAEKMWHYPDDGSLHLQHPLLTSYIGGAASYATARHGEIVQGGQEVRLSGEVVLARPDGQRFRTESLRVLPDEGVADTDQPVRMESVHGSLSATGLVLDNQARTVRMNHVKARHDPAH